jgi:hypothetical protein
MLLKILLKIPDVVWAAVIASLLTLGGVYLTNRGSYKRLLKQLEHESSQKDRERNMEIRRQVYLDAAEAITENHLILMKMSDLGISDSDLSKQFSKSAAIISKVYAIGSAKTVKTVSELTSAIGSRYLLLIAERIPLIQRKHEIEIQNELIMKASAERDQMIEIMKNVNLQGIQDDRLMSVAERNFKFQQDQVSKLLDKRNQLIEINGKEQIQLAMKCFQASREVSEYFAPAINSVREEMDIPFDEEAYRNTIEKGWEASEQSLKEFFSKITNC